jgi:hypothetical protein
MDDTDFKPLIQRLLKDKKRKEIPSFNNAEERIMHNFANKLGTFSS